MTKSYQVYAVNVLDQHGYGLHQVLIGGNDVNAIADRFCVDVDKVKPIDGVFTSIPDKVLKIFMYLE